MRAFQDGTSNTIGLVQTKRAIPWSKPEDIECSPDKPLPELGGILEGGFLCGMMDASIQFISDKADEKLLRAMFTRDGKERVQLNVDTNLPELKR